MYIPNDLLANRQQVIVMHDWFLPALIEKAKALMMTADWDQALEAAGRLQQQDAWAQRNEVAELGLARWWFSLIGICR